MADEPQKKECAELELLRAEVKRLREELDRLTPPLEVLLKRRGFRIYKREPADDLLIPAQPFIQGYYEMLKKYSFRLFLRDIIKHQPLFSLSQVARYATKNVTGEYIDYLTQIGLLARENEMARLLRGPIKSFGVTLEWFIAEIFQREFAAESIWGVKMKRPNVGGDYDLLSKLGGGILYMEIKSSPPKQIYQNEIHSFFERTYDLNPEIALFFVDTELRMKDKLVPMFEEELRVRGSQSHEVRRIKRELFEVASPMEKGRIFIMNAKDSIIQNIETIVACYYRRKQ